MEAPHRISVGTPGGLAKGIGGGSLSGEAFLDPSLTCSGTSQGLLDVIWGIRRPG